MKHIPNPTAVSSTALPDNAAKVMMWISLLSSVIFKYVLSFPYIEGIVNTISVQCIILSNNYIVVLTKIFVT